MERGDVTDDGSEEPITSAQSCDNCPLSEGGKPEATTTMPRLLAQHRSSSKTDDYPCDRALNYYRSTKTSSGSKRNYYDLGLDRNGMPYFGRGLIQLTGKGNYEKYGKLIGVDLLSDGDRALIPENSYKIASTYLKLKTFKHVNSGDLTRARKSVNGGTRGAPEVNDSYYMWLDVLGNSGFRKSILTRRGRQIALYSSLTLAILGTGFYIYYKKPAWSKGFTKRIDN